MYHAANFFAPSRLNTLLKFSNAEPFSFSAISSSPDFRRNASPPLGLLSLAIESAFAHFFCRIRDETGGFTRTPSRSSLSINLRRRVQDLLRLPWAFGDLLRFARSRAYCPGTIAIAAPRGQTALEQGRLRTRSRISSR